MKNKIMEEVFSHAVALDQSGRLKNEIYCHKNTVYILNYDRTVLLKFSIPGTGFKNPVGFFANDYDSCSFYEQDGNIVFSQKGEEFQKTKTCRVPNLSFPKVEKIFERFYSSPTVSSFSFHKNSLALLKEGLSHIEISSRNKKLVLIQRDLYSGTVIELSRKKGGFNLGAERDSIKKDFSPVGIRTNDFFGLFSFCKKISVSIPKIKGVFKIEGDFYGMKGIVSMCEYDELYSTGGKKNGRKKQKRGDS